MRQEQLERLVVQTAEFLQSEVEKFPELKDIKDRIELHEIIKKVLYSANIQSKFLVNNNLSFNKFSFEDYEFSKHTLNQFPNVAKFVLQKMFGLTEVGLSEIFSRNLISDSLHECGMFADLSTYNKHTFC